MKILAAILIGIILSNTPTITAQVMNTNTTGSTYETRAICPPFHIPFHHCNKH